MRIIHGLSIAAGVFGVWLLSSQSALSQTEPATIGTPSAAAVGDEDTPYGVAANYIVGRNLLLEGNASAALPYLHSAYRAQPEVMAIATDFQAALEAEGYLNDALEVVGKMVAAHPDSLAFLAQRANLYLKSGQSANALTDLRHLRQRGHVTLAVIDAEANILAASDRVEQAVDVYRDGLELLPAAGPQLYLGLARVLQNSGEDEQILPLMDEALGKFPDAPRLWLVKIRVLAVSGQSAEALQAAQEADTYFAGLVLAATAVDSSLAAEDGQAVTTVPPPESFVVELADFYAKRNDLTMAVGILQPLSEAGELQLTPSLWLGRLLLGTNKEIEGEALVARILERWPESGRAWFLRGKAAEGRDAWQEAIPHFAHAVELEPRDPEIRLGYLRAMLVAWEVDLTRPEPNEDQLARRTKFRRHLTVASTLVPDEDREGQLILGYGFKALADLEQAAQRFGLAAESADLRLNAMLQESLCYDQLGKDDEARLILEKLHEEHPQNPEVANSLGYYLAEKGQDLDQARDLVSLALAAEPGNGAFLDSMGWIEYRSGDLEKALDYLIQAVNVLPDDPVILEHLGVVLKSQGKNDEALDVLRRSLARGGDRIRLQALMDEIGPQQQRGR